MCCSAGVQCPHMNDRLAYHCSRYSVGLAKRCEIHTNRLRDRVPRTHYVELGLSTFATSTLRRRSQPDDEFNNRHTTRRRKSPWSEAIYCTHTSNGLHGRKPSGVSGVNHVYQRQWTSKWLTINQTTSRATRGLTIPPLPARSVRSVRPSVNLAVSHAP